MIKLSLLFSPSFFLLKSHLFQWLFRCRCAFNGSTAPPQKKTINKHYIQCVQAEKQMTFQCKRIVTDKLIKVVYPDPFACKPTTSLDLYYFIVFLKHRF